MTTGVGGPKKGMGAIDRKDECGIPGAIKCKKFF
jgi:hypothetical protein